MDGRRLFLVLCCASVVAGCGSSSSISLPNYAPPIESYTPSESSSNAFDHYALAAQDVEQHVDKALVNRVFFDPVYRAKALEAVSKQVGELEAATSKECQFKFTAAAPFTPAPYQRGWRMLGRALVWKIEDACSAEDYDRAVSEFLVATKFGFDLTGASAIDASLGFRIADDARKAIAPHLGKMGAGQLGRLAGVKEILAKKPPFTQVLENEHKNMMRGLQYIQDAYETGRYDPLIDNMGDDVRDAVTYLKDLKSQSENKKLKYFKGFAAEAEQESNWLKRVATMSVLQRGEEPEPVLEAQRPWKRFAKQFFQTAEPLLQIQDQTLARTRLLILSCLVLQQIKATGAAPGNLSDYKDLDLDPYSGRPFIYHAGGSSFELYSVGKDLQDNGHDTDETFTSPDLLLER